MRFGPRGPSEEVRRFPPVCLGYVTELKMARENDVQGLGNSEYTKNFWKWQQNYPYHKTKYIW